MNAQWANDRWFAGMEANAAALDADGRREDAALVRAQIAWARRVCRAATMRRAGRS